MKIIRAEFNGECFYGVLNGEEVLRLKSAPYDAIEYTGEKLKLSEVVLLPPAEPSKIVCIGKNYKAHADEMGEGQPPEPVLFIKPNTCIVYDGEDVVYPR